MISTHLTDEQRDKIVELYKADVPLKVIAYDFGTYASYISWLAQRRGLPSRYVRSDRRVNVKLRPDIWDRLGDIAKDQRTSREILAREAIAAYFGMGDAPC